MIEITENEFKLNGQSLTFPIPIAELTAALGEPSYVNKIQNHVYSWSDIGIKAYAKKQNLVDAFDVYFQIIGSHAHLPKQPFSEKVSINGQDVTAFYAKAKKRLDKNHSMQYGQFSLYFDVANSALEVMAISAFVAPAPKVYSDKYKPRTVVGETLPLPTLILSWPCCRC